MQAMVFTFPCTSASKTASQINRLRDWEFTFRCSERRSEELRCNTVVRSGYVDSTVLHVRSHILYSRGREFNWLDKATVEV